MPGCTTHHVLAHVTGGGIGVGVGTGVGAGVGCRGAGVWAAVIVSVMLAVVVALHAHKCFEHAGPFSTMVIDFERQVVHSIIKIQNFQGLAASVDSQNTDLEDVCTCNPIDFLKSTDFKSVRFHRRGFVDKPACEKANFKTVFQHKHFIFTATSSRSTEFTTSQKFRCDSRIHKAIFRSFSLVKTSFTLLHQLRHHKEER